jgi:hypothetical protein
MHDGRVVHFEDNQPFVGLIKDSLEVFGDGRHHVVGGAADLAGSLAVLDQISSGELCANIVIFDGNLGRGRFGGDDARAIKERMDALGLAVRAISCGGQYAAELGIKVDVDLRKGDFSLRKLVEIIDALDEPVARQSR